MKDRPCLGFLSKLPTLTMNPPNMILHIIHPAKNPITSRPLTRNLRVMLRLMPSKILLTREPTLGSLRATLKAAKQMFPVSIIVLAQVAGTREDGFGCAAVVAAAPGAG